MFSFLHLTNHEETQTRSEFPLGLLTLITRIMCMPTDNERKSDPKHFNNPTAIYKHQKTRK